MKDEEDVGIDMAGGSGIVCRIGVSGGRRRFEKTVTAAGVPGSAVRVSVRFRNDPTHSARILAFVDPLTGQGVIRMGMFDVSKDNRGHEVGSQLVYDTDAPVYDIEVDDETRS